MAREFSRRTELWHWVRKDKHAIARVRIEPLASGDPERLKANRTSYEMCMRLGYDIATDEGYARFRDNCLTCHGGYQIGSQVPEFSSRDRTKQQPGISCNHCHQIGQQKDWIDTHHKRDNDFAWRTKSPEEKAQAGMRNLVDMSAQASFCSNCHIGNIDQNRFVTHEMYAAGHPPLPAFEPETFCRETPQHWRRPDELYSAMANAGRPFSKSQAQEYFKRYYPDLFSEIRQGDSPSKVAWSTRKTLLGAVATRRQVAQLLAQAAKSDHWGDYALYDCSACHHELNRVSLRQRRGFPGAPGRPREMEWPRPLFEVAVSLANPEGVVDGRLRGEERLATAVGARPFGDPVKVQAAANRLLGELDALERSLSGMRMYTNDAARALDQLATLPWTYLIEYDSARNIIWGLRNVGEETGRSIPDQFQAQLLSMVQLDLPAGIDRPGRQSSISLNLADELERRAAYSPEKLQQLLQSLAP